MDKFTETIANNIIAIIKSKLKGLEEQGILVEIIEPKFSDICIEAKIVLNLTNASSEAEKERERFFKEQCASVGLRPEHYGKTFVTPMSVIGYRIAGLDFHEEDPVLVQRLDNLDRFYRMSVLDVKRFI